MNNDNKKTMLAYLAVCFFWGSTYLAIRIGVSDLPPFMFAGIRFCAAGGLMILFSKLKNYSFPHNMIDIMKLSIVGLLMLLGGNGLVVFAEQWVHSGIACLLVATVPLFMTIIEIFILKNKIMDYKGFLGLILGFGGVAYLSLGNNGIGVIDFKGIFLLLTASFFWSLGSIFSQTFQASGSIISNVGIQTLAGGIGLVIVGSLSGEVSNIHFTFNSVFALLYLIFFGSIVGYSSYIYVLKKWPASKAGTYAYVNPVVAVVLGAVILDEPITFSILFSMLIIIMGVYLVQSAKVEDSKAKSRVEKKALNH